MFEEQYTEQAVMESVYIELDPVLDGFQGVVVELSHHGQLYVLTETALGSGSTLLRFRSTDRAFAHELFRQLTSGATLRITS